MRRYAGGAFVATTVAFFLAEIGVASLLAMSSSATCTTWQLTNHTNRPSLVRSVVPHLLIGGVIIRPESPQISNWHGLLRSRGPCSEVYRQKQSRDSVPRSHLRFCYAETLVKEDRESYRIRAPNGHRPSVARDRARIALVLLR
jgi:hypothetical protein